MALTPGARSIPGLFWSRVVQRGERTAMREKDLGVWRDVIWREYGAHARQVALGLIALGLAPGDRVGIIGENTPEWLYTDLGVQSAGGVSVGIYPTAAPKQVAYVMAHSGARFYLAEDEEQLDKILEVRAGLPALVKIIVFDMEGLRHFRDPMVLSFAEHLAMGAASEARGADELDRRLAAIGSDDVAILIYTSGTTGPPKGAMITHGNVLAVLEMQDAVNPIHETDEALSFLPLCHIAERIGDKVLIARNCHRSVLTGLIMSVLGYAFFTWATYSNAYFSQVVRIQTERGHTVATDGPYRFIRHPGYISAMVSELALSALLGSWVSLIVAAVCVVLFVVRTILEDRTLQTDLPGYREYAERVRYHLIVMQNSASTILLIEDNTSRRTTDASALAGS